MHYQFRCFGCLLSVVSLKRPRQQCAALTRGQNNLWKLWCGYQCSPYQKNFVEVTGSFPRSLLQELGPELNTTIPSLPTAYETTFRVSSVFAEHLYESCAGTPLNGGIVVGDTYADYEDLLAFFASTNIFQDINFEFADDDVFYADAESCEGQCPCETCHLECEWDMDYIYPSPCTITMFNEPMNCDTLGTLMFYGVFLLVGFYAMIGWYYVNVGRHYSPEQPVPKSISIIFAGLTLAMAGAVFVALGLILWPILIDYEYVEVFNSNWNIATVVFVAVGFVMILLGEVVAAGVVLYLITVSHEGVIDASTEAYFAGFSHDEDSDDEGEAEEAPLHIEDYEPAPKRLHSFSGSDNGFEVSKSIQGKEGSVDADMPADSADAESESSSTSSSHQTKATKKKSIVTRYFEWHGRFCVRHPFWVLGAGVLLTFGFSLGMLELQIQNNPVLLWSTTTSQSYQQMEFSNEYFGAYWRVEMMIFTSKEDPGSSMVTLPILNELLTIQSKVRRVCAPLAAALHSNTC